MSSHDLSDEALMAAYLDGSEAAMRELVRRYAPRLHGFFRRHASISAEDCVQQTFLHLHRARARYERGRSFKAWLFTIAANVRVDAWRQGGGKGTPELLEDDDPRTAEPPTVEAAIDRERLKAVIERALAALPEPQRAVVHLHFFEGLSFAEIAAALGSNENAIKQKAFRAYTNLRAQLPALEQP
jgi:RNA polymerase sigma-70 factor (ECF subfamily)